MEGMANKAGIKKLKEIALRMVKGEVAARLEIWKQEFQVAKILARYTRAKAQVCRWIQCYVYHGSPLPCNLAGGSLTLPVRGRVNMASDRMIHGAVCCGT